MGGFCSFGGGGGSSCFLHPNPSAVSNQCLNLTGGFLRRVLRVRREQRSDDCPFVSLPLTSPSNPCVRTCFLSALATARPDSVNDMTLIRFVAAYRSTRRTRRTRRSWWTGSSELKPLGLHQTLRFLSSLTYANHCTYMVARDVVSVELCSKFREQTKNKQTCQDLFINRLYFRARVHILFNAITP